MHPLEEKIFLVKNSFISCKTAEERYLLLMDWGKKLPPYPKEKKTEKYRVRGCQSELFLCSEKKEGRVFFYAESNALISAGFAALLFAVFNGEPADAILQTSPKFLEELGILQSLSPGRSHGLGQLYRALVAHTLINPNPVEGSG